VLRAASPESLLVTIHRSKWNRASTIDQLRHDLAERAWVWSRTLVRPSSPAPVLIAELAEAGLFELLPPEPAPPKRGRRS
jgi:hypothetical protein